MFFLLLSPLCMMAQTVTGKVISADDGAGLPGVNVIEKGTTNGTITDADGRYSIQLRNPSPSALVFSMVGMVKEERRVTGGNKVDVVLQADNYQLDQVVVTGYSTQRKADLTGSVSVVTVDEIREEKRRRHIETFSGRG